LRAPAPPRARQRVSRWPRCPARLGWWSCSSRSAPTCSAGGGAGSLRSPRRGRTTPSRSNPLGVARRSRRATHCPLWRDLPMRRLILVTVIALALLAVGGTLRRPATPAPAAAAPAATTDQLTAAIAHAQDRLRTLPKDWHTWAALASAYVEQARVTADPTYYPKAEGAVRQSLSLKPDANVDALIARGALANARHDFASARVD